MEKLEHFAGLLVDLEIAKEILPILLDNGFDDWEQTVEIINKPEILEQIGITDNNIQKQILAAISAAEDYEPSQPQNQQEQLPEQQQQDQEEEEDYEEEKISAEELDEMKHVQRQNQIYMNLVQKIQSKPLTIQILKSGSQQKKTNKSQTDDAFFEQLQVINLGDKKLTKLEFIEKCSNIQHLHLYKNSLLQIDPQIQALRNLKILRLENNYLTQIEHLNQCVNLNKLYLNYNFICRLENLENCQNLQELQLSHQQSGQNFEFCEKTLQSLGMSLSTLEMENSYVRTIPKEFGYLQCLQNLNFKNNNIAQYEDFIEPFRGLRMLYVFQVKGNPITKQPKYRDRLVLLSESLQDLDGKKILPKERQFLYNLWKKKNGGFPDPQKPNQTAQQKVQLQKVQGKQIQMFDQDVNNGDFQRLNSNQNFFGNQTVQSSKHVPNPRYY